MTAEVRDGCGGGPCSNPRGRRQCGVGRWGSFGAKTSSPCALASAEMGSGCVTRGGWPAATASASQTSAAACCLVADDDAGASACSGPRAAACATQTRRPSPHSSLRSGCSSLTCPNRRRGAKAPPERTPSESGSGGGPSPTRRPTAAAVSASGSAIVDATAIVIVIAIVTVIAIVSAAAASARRSASCASAGSPWLRQFPSLHPFAPRRLKPTTRRTARPACFGRSCLSPWSPQSSFLSRALPTPRPMPRTESRPIAPKSWPP